MPERKDNRKSIKIRPDAHDTLKEYCEENGLKMEWFLSKIIHENCKIETKIEKD